MVKNVIKNNKNIVIPKFTIVSDIDDTLNLRAGTKLEYKALKEISNLIRYGIHFNANSGKPAYYTKNKQIKQLIQLLGSKYIPYLSVSGNNGAETILNPFHKNEITILYDVDKNNAHNSIKQLNHIGNIITNNFGLLGKEQINAKTKDNQRLIYTLFPVSEVTYDLKTSIRKDMNSSEYISEFQNHDNEDFLEMINKELFNDSDNKTYQNLLKITKLPTAKDIEKFAIKTINKELGDDSEIVCVGHSDTAELLLNPKNGTPINKGESVSELIVDYFGIDKIHILEAVKIVKKYVGESFNEQQYIDSHSEYVNLAIAAGDGGNDKELLEQSLFSITVDIEKTKEKGLHKIATTIVKKDPFEVVKEMKKMLKFVKENNLEYN